MPAGTPLSDRAKRLLQESIPERLAELYGCARIIEALAKEPPDSAATIQLSNSLVLECSPARPFLLHPCLDAAIITCRNLLKLLGIGLPPNSTTVKTYQSRPFDTDAWMPDFGLQPVPVSDAYEKHPPPFTEGDVERVILAVLKAGNRGIGHLTDESARDIITVRDTSRACDIVITLVNRHIYGKLDDDIISELALPKSGFSFESGSEYGHVEVI